MYLSIKAYSKESLIEFYNIVKEGSLQRPAEHVLDEVMYKGIKITFYKTGTVLFHGDISGIHEEMKTLVDKEMYVGVDEVGVGENVGPFVACAVKFNDYESKFRSVLAGIKDSKKMTAKEIEKSAAVIKENAEVRCTLLEPVVFNKHWVNIGNVKELNALVQNSLLIKFDANNKFITDEFVNSKKYTEYLDKNNVSERREVQLLQKADDKYVEVSAGAIVAKAEFNRWMKEFAAEHNLPLQIKDRLNANKLWTDLKEGKVQFDKPELILKEWAK